MTGGEDPGPAESFRALGDETRIRIVSLLRDRELSVNEIVRILGTGQSGVSRHLKILADRGFLRCRRDGLWAFYSVPEEGEGRRLLDSVSYLFARSPRLLDDGKRAYRMLEERSGESARFFNTLAGNWDRIKREVLGSLDVFSEVESWIPSDGAVADLGCGTGDLLLRLSDGSRKVIGVDNSPKMLDKARQRFESGGGRTEIRMGEMEHLPLRDQEARCAIFNMVLHHLPVPLEGVREAARVLSPGGRLIVAELGKHSDEQMRRRFGDRWLGFDRAELEGWLGAAGFRTLHSRRLAVGRGMDLQLLCGEKIRKENHTRSGG